MCIRDRFYNDEPNIFDNREYLYLTNYSDFDDGYVGVWEWSATENLSLIHI